MASLQPARPICGSQLILLAIVLHKSLYQIIKDLWDCKVDYMVDNRQGQSLKNKGKN